MLLIIAFVAAPGVAYYLFGKRDLKLSLLYALSVLGFGLLIGMFVHQGVIGLALMFGAYYYLLTINKMFKVSKWVTTMLVGFGLQILIGVLIGAAIIAEVLVNLVRAV